FPERIFLLVYRCKVCLFCFLPPASTPGVASWPAWQCPKTHCISLSSFSVIFWMMKISKKRFTCILNLLNNYIARVLAGNRYCNVDVMQWQEIGYFLGPLNKTISIRI